MSDNGLRLETAAPVGGDGGDPPEKVDLPSPEGLRAPFPWFGGKRRVAPIVWEALGDVANYVEPFAGSLAVLLGRPDDHERKIETVNDLDGYIANFWRALASDPDAVAEYADWPVNEADLTARHLWLVNDGRTLLERLMSDPDACDAKVAGWWVWGLCAWIGGGWCSGKGSWRGVEDLGNEGQGVNRKLPHLGDGGQGVNRKLPHLGNEGRGVNRRLPHLGDGGRGVNRQLPHLGSGGQGVNRKLPHLGDGGRGVNRQHADGALHEYFGALAARLRRVRVCCGDWQRVVTDGALSSGKTVGVFLDPPYLNEVRSKVYNTDDNADGLSHDVRAWALAHGDDPRYRIVLAGYEPEHDGHIPNTWRRVAWTAGRAYGRASGKTKNSDNRSLERLWLSPHCIDNQMKLF